MRDGQGDAPAGPARLAHHVRRARRRAGRGGARRTWPASTSKWSRARFEDWVAGRAPFALVVRRDGVALDRSTVRYRQGSRGAAARRSPRNMGGGARRARRRRPVLRRAAGRLRRDRRGAAHRRRAAAAAGAARRPSGHRGERAVRRRSTIAQYDWETTYDAEGYIDLLNTFSGHIAMAGLAARPAVRRDPSAPRGTARRAAAPALGCRPARVPTTVVKRSSGTAEHIALVGAGHARGPIHPVGGRGR